MKSKALTHLSTLFLALSLFWGGSANAKSLNLDNVAVGARYVATSSLSPMTQLHLLLGVTEFVSVGFGIGFLDGFSQASVGGDIRYTVAQRGASSMFGLFQASFHKQGTGGSSGGAELGLLYGLAHKLSDAIGVEMAYGLQMGFGNGVGTRIGTTNTIGWVGNFGVHWFF